MAAQKIGVSLAGIDASCDLDTLAVDVSNAQGSAATAVIDAAAAQVAAAAALAAVNGAVPGGGRTVTDLPTYLADNAVFNVKDYGATGNGVTDDTTAIRAAITAATTGSTLLFPHGTYAITGTITLSKSLSVRGSSGGESGGVTSPVGSILKGSGFTLLLMQQPCLIQGLAIQDSVGNAATIALDINNGATGVVNWCLRDVFLTGTAGQLGTGIRCIFGLKGVVENCTIEGWSIGIDLQASGGTLKSNANRISGSRIRVNATGLKTTTIDNVFVIANIFEGNSVNGIEHDTGLLVLIANHLENLATGANVKVNTGANLNSQGNGYYDTPANGDIWVTAGAAIHTSDSDTLNNGVKHNGTGNFVLKTPLILVPLSGTGPVISIDGSGIQGLQNTSGENVVVKGFAFVSVDEAIVNMKAATPLSIGGTTGVWFCDASGTPKGTMDQNGNTIFLGNFGVNGVGAQPKQAVGAGLNAYSAGANGLAVAADMAALVAKVSALEAAMRAFGFATT